MIANVRLRPISSAAVTRGPSLPESRSRLQHGTKTRSRRGNEADPRDGWKAPQPMDSAGPGVRQSSAALAGNGMRKDAASGPARGSRVESARGRAYSRTRSRLVVPRRFPNPCLTASAPQVEIATRRQSARDRPGFGRFLPVAACDTAVEAGAPPRAPHLRSIPAPRRPRRAELPTH